jgi:hypothetical protein
MKMDNDNSLKNIGNISKKNKSDDNSDPSSYSLAIITQQSSPGMNSSPVV